MFSSLDNSNVKFVVFYQTMWLNRLISIKVVEKYRRYIAFTNRSRSFDREVEELEFREDLYTSHFTLSENRLDRDLVRKAQSVERLATELRVPCFLHDPDRNQGVKLALAEEMANQQFPQFLHSLEVFKTSLLGQLEREDLLRCLSCKQFISRSQFDGLDCCGGSVLRVELDEVFFRVVNFWAKKLRRRC